MRTTELAAKACRDSSLRIISHAHGFSAVADSGLLVFVLSDEGGPLCWEVRREPNIGDRLLSGFGLAGLIQCLIGLALLQPVLEQQSILGRYGRMTLPATVPLAAD